MHLKLVLILLATLFVVEAPMATEQQDAQFIAESTASEEIFESALSVMAPALSDALQNRLRQQGIEVSDPDTLTRIVGEEMVSEFAKEMQKEYVKIFLEMFTQQELADIAAFFRSSSGEAYLSKQIDIMAYAVERGNVVGDRMNSQIGPRVARRIKEENIEITEPSTLDKRIMRWSEAGSGWGCQTDSAGIPEANSGTSSLISILVTLPFSNVQV